MRKGKARRSWSWNAPLQFDLSRAEIFQEILAGIMGWQTVVTSFALYAGLFVNDDDVDKNATAEIFMLVAGVSTIIFGLATDLPFLVAPSVLYVARETGITMGGQLAAQALANAAATVVFACAVKIKLVSYIPTALRMGAGCGVAMLVGVLGMRSVGLLVADAFVLPPFTWETVVGLAVVTVASMTAPPQSTAHKWIYVFVVPLALTVAVYAVIDRSKFKGYSAEERLPLSNWNGGSLGLVDVSALSDAPSSYALYIVRTFLSIVINVTSILLVLIDTVCLQRLRGVLRSAGETDFSDAIGGTNKFRRMACAIPMMSFVGNLAGVTTQEAFVESMIIVFAGGKSGLSAVVTGFLFILSTVIWPLLPVLVPAHISGALTIVVTLRFFTVIRMIDVTHTSNLLMFGVPIILIPFSFDFVDALCVATLLGFVCGVGNHIMSHKIPEQEATANQSNLEGGVTQDMTTLEYEVHRHSTRIYRGKEKVLGTISDGDSSNATSLPRISSEHSAPETPLPARTRTMRGLLPIFARHKVLPDLPAPLVKATPQTDKEEGKQPEAGRQGARQKTPLSLVSDLFSGFNLRRPRSYTDDLSQDDASVDNELAQAGADKGLALGQSSAEVMHDRNIVSCSTPDSCSAISSIRHSTPRELRQAEVGTPPKLHTVAEPDSAFRGDRSCTFSETQSGNGPTVHWKLAVVATMELVLKVVSDQFKG